MASETLNYSDENITASLEISEANVLVGMRRSRMRWAAQKFKTDDVDRLILRFYTYPDVLSAVISGSIKAGDREFQADKPDWITFEEFLELPDKLLFAWENLVYKLNPHWQLVNADDPKEPSELTPSPADSPSTSTRQRHKRNPKKSESRK